MAATLPWPAPQVLTISVALSENPDFIRISLVQVHRHCTEEELTQNDKRCAAGAAQMPTIPLAHCH